MNSNTSTRTRTASDVRATVYQCANRALHIAGEEFGEELTITGPKGAQAYASLSTHCFAVMQGLACAGDHDAHVDTLATWGAVEVTNPGAYKVAKWLLAMNGGQASWLGMSAEDVVQDTVLVLISTGQALTLERVMACAGDVLAHRIELSEDDSIAQPGTRIPLEWLA